MNFLGDIFMGLEEWSGPSTVCEVFLAAYEISFPSAKIG